MAGMAGWESSSHPPETRFRIALLVSAALHAVVLGFWNQTKPVNPGGKRPLTVNFSPRSGPAERVMSEPRVKEEKLPPSVLVQASTRPTDVEFHIAPPPQKTVPAPVAIGVPSRTEARSHAMPAGMVEVLLTIDEDGKPRDVIWSKLPALTREEFRRLEQAMRQKSYPSFGRTYTVTEVIEPHSMIQAFAPRPASGRN